MCVSHFLTLSIWTSNRLLCFFRPQHIPSTSASICLCASVAATCLAWASRAAAALASCKRNGTCEVEEFSKFSQVSEIVKEISKSVHCQEVNVQIYFQFAQMFEVFKGSRCEQSASLSPNLLSSDFLMSSVNRIFSASFALSASWDIEKQKIKLQTQTCCHLPASSSPPQPIWNSPARTPAIETWQVWNGMARWRHDQIWIDIAREARTRGLSRWWPGPPTCRYDPENSSPSLFLKKFVGTASWPVAFD